MKYLALIGCLLAWGCQTTPQATIDFDPEVDFSGYQTFSWIDPNPLIRAVTQRPLSPLVEQRLMNDTRNVLTGRGMRFVEDPTQADLVVAFTIGSREGVRVTSFPTNSLHHPRGQRASRTHTWRGYWRTSTVQTRQYTEGQLAIDLFSVAEARPVWHGATARRVTRQERAEPEAAIQAAVKAILDQFPPG